MEIIGGVAVMISSIAILGFFRAWAATLLWDWFVAPFFELPNLPILTAYGIILLIHLVSPSADDRSKDRDEGLKGTEIAAKLIGVGVLGPLVCVGIGWIIQRFI